MACTESMTSTVMSGPARRRRPRTASAGSPRRRPARPPRCPRHEGCEEVRSVPAEPRGCAARWSTSTSRPSPGRTPPSRGLKLTLGDVVGVRTNVSPELRRPYGAGTWPLDALDSDCCHVSNHDEPRHRAADVLGRLKLAYRRSLTPRRAVIGRPSASATLGVAGPQESSSTPALKPVGSLWGRLYRDVPCNRRPVSAFRTCAPCKQRATPRTYPMRCTSALVSSATTRSRSPPNTASRSGRPLNWRPSCAACRWAGRRHPEADATLRSAAFKQPPMHGDPYDIEGAGAATRVKGGARFPSGHPAGRAVRPPMLARGRYGTGTSMPTRYRPPAAYANPRERQRGHASRRHPACAGSPTWARTRDLRINRTGHSRPGRSEVDARQRVLKTSQGKGGEPNLSRTAMAGASRQCQEVETGQGLPGRNRTGTELRQ